MSRRGWLAVLLVVLAGAGGWGLYRFWWSPQQSERVTEAPLLASGVIQARQIMVASEIGGVIAALPLREGQAVAAGEVVVRLDTALLDGELAVAQARLAWAEAGLRRAQAGAREGAIAVAEAELDRAHAGHRMATRAVADTRALVRTPQELDLEILAVRGRLDSARHTLARAAAMKDALEVAKGVVERAMDAIGEGGRQRFPVLSGDIAELDGAELPPELVDLLPDDPGERLGDRTVLRGDYELHLRDGRYEVYVWRDVSLPLEAHLVPNQWWQAWVHVNAAGAQVEGLEAKLNHLYAQRAAPQALQAREDEALLLEAEAAQYIVLAQAQVDGLRAGLTVQELAVIEAQVGQARAAVEALELKRDLLALTSPITGTVVRTLLREGEVAAQGAPLLTVADLRDLLLTVYVPERRLADIWLDQEVEVLVHGFPERVWRGRVTHLSDQAEFTPRNVATEEQRESLVFGVEIRLDNSDGALKPGMPAEARFLGVER
jgi:multidrug efflux pump subunit AcrA (membrane-fusion protein)